MVDVPNRIETIDQLGSHFKEPSERVRGKAVDRLNAAMATFVDHVSFLVLATLDGLGSCDASPRGGPPGFVRRLDDRHVAIPDLAGNNRIDSYRNIVQHPHVGLLLIVPGMDETLRINGPAALTDDPELLAGFTNDLRPPRLALVVEIAEVYGHCAKAFRRGRVWQPERWPSLDGVPDMVEIYSCEPSFGITDVDATRSAIRDGYDRQLAED